jgi:hypothetical protein
MAWAVEGRKDDKEGFRLKVLANCHYSIFSPHIRGQQFVISAQLDPFQPADRRRAGVAVVHILKRRGTPRSKFQSMKALSEALAGFSETLRSGKQIGHQ